MSGSRGSDHDGRMDGRRRDKRFLALTLTGQPETELVWQRFLIKMDFAIVGHANREIRLMLEQYRVFSPNGQFYNERLRYTGLGVHFDLWGGFFFTPKCPKRAENRFLEK